MYCTPSQSSGLECLSRQESLGLQEFGSLSVSALPIQMGMEVYLDSVVVACECARDQSLDLFFSVMITRHAASASRLGVALLLQFYLRNFDGAFSMKFRPRFLCAFST